MLSGAPTSLSTLVASATNPLLTTTSTLYAIAQDTAGLTMLPTTSDGYCGLASTLASSSSTSASSSSSSSVHVVSFGQDSKFGCWVSLSLVQLQAVCLAGVGAGAGGVPGLFGNISTSLGVWGNSDFRDVNQWISIKQSLPTVGVRHGHARTHACTHLSTNKANTLRVSGPRSRFINQPGGCLLLLCSCVCVLLRLLCPADVE